MKKEGDTRKIVLLAVLVVALVFIAFKVQRYFTKPAVPGALIPSTSSVPFDAFPQYFPAGVFIESDAKVTSNRQISFPDGRVGGSRGYQTKVEPTQVVFDYEDYLESLEENGWTLAEPVDGDITTVLGAQNGPDSLIIYIKELEDVEGSVVEIIFLTKK